MTTMFERSIELLKPPTTNTIPARIAVAAEELSRAGNMQTHLDTVMSSMMALISVLYATDADKRPANYDYATGRILLRPLPWGESGWQKWGLRRWEGNCLRRLLLDRVGTRRRLPALFDYNQYARQWHINAGQYKTTEEALAWIRKDGPTLAEWRSIVTDYQRQGHERMKRFRG